MRRVSDWVQEQREYKQQQDEQEERIDLVFKYIIRAEIVGILFVLLLGIFVFFIAKYL